ncbi:MAG: hypothetical protein HA490_00005 [Archaeoglobales archaeon]|nr:hypothetical protein [Archaeoglobales archaeon]
MDYRVFRYLVHFIFLCISGKIIGDIREVKKRINLAKTIEYDVPRFYLTFWD